MRLFTPEPWNQLDDLLPQIDPEFAIRFLRFSQYYKIERLVSF